MTGHMTPVLRLRSLHVALLALLTRTGDGHTSLFTSDCAKSAMDAFLIDRRSEANRICEG